MIQMPLKAGRSWPKLECWLGIFVIVHGNRSSIATKPYSFVIFHWGRGVLGPLPHLDPRMILINSFSIVSCIIYRRLSAFFNSMETGIL